MQGKEKINRDLKNIMMTINGAIIIKSIHMEHSETYSYFLYILYHTHTKGPIG